MRHNFALTATLAFASATLSAQTPTGLIGLTDTTPLLVRQDPNTCRTAVCKVTDHKLTARQAGGTAYDSRRDGVWVTSGSVISMIDPLGCRVLCKPHRLAIGGFATGLAMYEPKGLLLIPTTADVIYTVEASCPTKVLTRCNLQGVIPTGWDVGGIAVDDHTGTVFYTASNFGAAVPQTILYVADIGRMCNPFCKVQIRACGNSILRQITGVAWDGCKKIVWVTDGRQTSGYNMPDPKQCSRVKNVKCCPLQLTTRDSYVGLCVMPSRPTSMGKSCTARPCPSCPSMRLTMSNGLPTIPNNAFTLNIVNAPAGAQAYFAINLGACQAPGIAGIFCAPIHVNLGAPGPYVIGPIPTGGTTGCTGSAKLNLPIRSTSLCGRTFSTQGIVFCRGLTGRGITNCLSWTPTMS